MNGAVNSLNELLGDKIIHPFSDFLLHDVGTGDGIVQNGGQFYETQRSFKVHC
ncbi:MAG TPA: hypothetical protein VKB46_04500 [Pyrinomonadaceae bacterium]|nr:hypothetical protein [Pyrinomonadaceae bacterium]